MINYDNVTKENIKNHYPNWPKISDHPYRILIIRGSGSGKTNALLNLMKQQDDYDYIIIVNIHLYVKDPNEQNINIIIKKREKNSLENLKDPKAFI